MSSVSIININSLREIYFNILKGVNRLRHSQTHQKKIYVPYFEDCLIFLLINLNYTIYINVRHTMHLGH